MSKLAEEVLETTKVKNINFGLTGQGEHELAAFNRGVGWGDVRGLS